MVKINTDKGFSTTLQMTHLRQPAFDGISDIMQNTRIPSQLEYNDVIAKEAAIPTEEDHVTITPSTIVPSELGTRDGRSFVAPSQIRDTIAQSPAMVSDNGDTQTSNVPRIKSALEGFMLPEMLTQVSLSLSLRTSSCGLICVVRQRATPRPSY